MKLRELSLIFFLAGEESIKAWCLSELDARTELLDKDRTSSFGR